MLVEVPKELRDRIIKYYDGDFLGGKIEDKEKATKEYQQLLKENMLDESIVIDILNRIYNLADLYKQFNSIKNVNAKTRLEELRKEFDKNEKPDEKTGEFEETKTPQEYGKMIKTLKNCFSIVDLVNDGVRMEKQREDIAKEVINSISYIEDNNMQIPSEVKIDELYAIRNNLQKLIDSENLDNSNIQEEINKYNEKAQMIWSDFLSKPENMLVHVGIIDGEYSNKFISTSLITEKEVATFTPHGYGMGMIIKPKHILIADSNDTLTHNDREYSENVSNDMHPIKLPQQIEDEIVQKNLEKNGELLNYSVESIYSEIVVDDFEMGGIFIITNGEGEKNPDYHMCQKLAEEQNLDFKEINLSNLREKEGLKPLSSQVPYNPLKREEEQEETYRTEKLDTERNFKFSELKEVPSINIGKLNEQSFMEYDEETDKIDKNNEDLSLEEYKQNPLNRLLNNVRVKFKQFSRKVKEKISDRINKKANKTYEDFNEQDNSTTQVNEQHQKTLNNENKSWELNSTQLEEIRKSQSRIPKEYKLNGNKEIKKEIEQQEEYE